jgi:gluconolactonase
MKVGTMSGGKFPRVLASLGTLAAFVLTTAGAQTGASPARPFTIERSDPALDEIVAPGTEAELLGDRYGLLEGPVWVQDGNEGFLLFSDLISNVIWKRTPSGELSVYLENAGYTGDDLLNAGTQTRRGRMHVLLIGPNGLTLDSEGRLIYCATPDRAVMRLEPDGTRTLIADRFDGKRFNGPNDVVTRSDDIVYFTDSDFGLRGSGASPDKELAFNGVYMVRNDEVHLLVDDEALGGFPNGITLSPEERYLYVNAGFNRMMRFEVRADGTLGDGTVFFEGGGGIVDGMKTDLAGNLYSTGGAGPGEVRITAPDGSPLGRLHLPVIESEPRPQVCATNVAFGDVDGRGLYITACEHLYRVRLLTPGVMPGPSSR